jgi:CheY-like chemotaxis protein
MQNLAQRIDLNAKRILIVEDHRDSRDALRALLEAFGYDVVEATNGRDAITCAAAARPHIVLMDIMMPEVDGFDATRAIHAIPGLERVPIIAITAMEGVHELAMQAGMSDYVRKPLDIRGLLKKLSMWLEPSPS